jgi:hypothetical protein
LSKNLWTPEEIERLKQLAGTMSCKQIGKELGRSKDAVKNKISTFKLPSYTSVLLAHAKVEKKRIRKKVVKESSVARREPMQSIYRNPKLIKTETVSRLEWCKTCHSPVSNWEEHRSRLGCTRIA